MYNRKLTKPRHVTATVTTSERAISEVMREAEERRRGAYKTVREHRSDESDEAVRSLVRANGQATKGAW